jgi:hypothetical protein
MKKSHLINREQLGDRSVRELGQAILSMCSEPSKGRNGCQHGVQIKVTGCQSKFYPEKYTFKMTKGRFEFRIHGFLGFSQWIE